MAICKWCGEEFEPGTWPEHCSENCLVNDMDNTCTSEEREKLQEKFNRWLKRQEATS